MKRKPDIRPEILIALPVAIATLLALSLIAAFSGEDEVDREEAGPVMRDATIVADCDPCSTGTSIRLSGEGYDPDHEVVTVSIGGLAVATPVSADGSIALEWTGFEEAGSYSVEVYSASGRSESRLEASLDLTVAEQVVPTTDAQMAEKQSQAPTARDDAATTHQGEAITIDVLANDDDPDGDIATASVSVECRGCAPTSNGTVRADVDGTITYVPDSGKVGTDSFGYQVCDEANNCDTATVMIDVVSPSVGLGVPDAFHADSFWNTPIGADAEIHPNSNAILDYLRRDNSLDGCIQLAGVEGNSWGMPVYVSGPSDPVYDVVENKYTLPPELSSLRIPEGARTADTSDGEMVVYDLAVGVVAQLSKASYDASEDRWSANGGSVAYLDSNGLDGRLEESDEPRNIGTFRGYPGAVTMVHYDDVAAGKLDNVVKIGVNNANAGFVFPLVGSDGDTKAQNAPTEGARIRVKPEVDLEALGLSGQALVIAKGLQEYGMIVGDNTGGGVVLKLEDTHRSGRGSLWDLDTESLCAITTDHLEVMRP